MVLLILLLLVSHAKTCTKRWSANGWLEWSNLKKTLNIELKILVGKRKEIVRKMLRSVLKDILLTCLILISKFLGGGGLTAFQDLCSTFNKYESRKFESLGFQNIQIRHLRLLHFSNTNRRIGLKQNLTEARTLLSRR